MPTSLPYLFVFLTCFLLAACSSTLRLEDVAGEQAAIGCSGVSRFADDKSRASPEQLKLLSEGKAHYRDGDYALAEKSFRKATEASSFGKSGKSRVANLEAWFGLAASYDQLKRFDLADQIYEHIRTDYGPSVTYHNNYGYSLELRGEDKLAQSQYRMAMDLAPDCQISRNNLAASTAN